MEKLKNEFLTLHKRQRENTRILDPRFQIQRHHLFVRYVGPDSTTNTNGLVFTNIPSMNRASAQEFVRSQIIFFRNLRRNFEWKFSDYDLPACLPDLIKEEGLSIDRTETIMVKECKESVAVDEIPGIEFRELTDIESFADIGIVQEEVWGVDFKILIASLRAEKQADPNALRVFVAYAEKEPVSCAWLRLDPYFGTLLGGSTRKEWRGKGIYAQMVKRRSNLAHEKGLRFVSSDAGPMSAPLLEKLDFFPAATVTRFHFQLR